MRYQHRLSSAMTVGALAAGCLLPLAGPGWADAHPGELLVTTPLAKAAGPSWLHPGFYALDAHSATDGWAVGSIDPEHGGTSYARRDGATWSLRDGPGTHHGVLRGVAAVDSDDAWAVGSAYDRRQQR